MLESLTITEKIKKYFGDALHYVVFSGKGIHVYLPLKNPLKKDEMKHYKESYVSFTQKLDKEVKGFVDKEVFKTWVLGRIPNSINSKNGVKVRFIGKFGSEAKDINELFAYSIIQEPLEIPVVEEKEKLFESPRYVNCNFIRYIHKNIDTAPYDLFSKAMYALTDSKEFLLMKEIVKGSKRANEIANFAGKNYSTSCNVVNKQFVDLGEDLSLIHI